MEDVILIITEGKKPEFSLLTQIKAGMFPASERNVVKAYWHTDLLDLCNSIKDDPFLDYFTVLKGMHGNEELDSVSEEAVSEIYLFFDYDVHGPSKYLKGGRDEYDSMLLSVLEFCNNETEPRGKLYVSYPMVEAVWQVPMNCNGTSCLVSSSELKIYKKNISDNFALRSRPFEIDSCLYHMHRHLERIAAFCASVITDLSLDSFLLLDCALLHRLEMHLLKTHD